MNNKPSSFKNRNVFQLQLRFNLFFTLMKIVQWAIRIEICNCKCLTNQNHLRCSNTLRALFTDLRINVLQSKRLLKMSQSQKFDWSTLNRSLTPLDTLSKRFYYIFMHNSVLFRLFNYFLCACHHGVLGSSKSVYIYSREKSSIFPKVEERRLRTLIRRPAVQ